MCSEIWLKFFRETFWQNDIFWVHFIRFKPVGHTTLTLALQWYMELFSASLAMCEGNPPVNGGLTHIGLAMRRFNVSFAVSLNKMMNRQLTHWGRVTHICVGNLTIIGSDSGLSPGRRQAIIWTNAGILSIGPLGTDFSEILIKIHTFSFKKMNLKMSSGKWRPFCLGLNVLSQWWFETQWRSRDATAMSQWRLQGVPRP